MTQPITHSRWLRGLQSGFDRYSQPKGSVSRISNLVFTRRGAFKAADGSLLITTFNGTLQPAANNFGPITAVFLYQPTGAAVSYFGIVKDTSTHIGAPAGLAAAAGAAGALTGVYKYVITALDGVGGETVASNEATVTLTAQKGSPSWTAVTNANGGYNVYRTVAGGGAGTERFVATVPGQATVSYIDNLVDGSLGAGTPPLVDNTQVCQFYQFTTPSYGVAQIVKTFPADLGVKVQLPVEGGGTPGGGGGSGSGGGGPSGFQPPTSAGGVSGNVSVLPKIVQFVNKMVLALGNGFPPYLSDGTPGGTVAITNTFTASYPLRASSTAYNLGDQVEATVSATLYVFTAVQGGITSSGAFAPSAVLGSTTPDGNVIWKNSGQVTNSPSPPGAAHAEVYAGSLWVANTSPTITADQLDGPSALRMSLLNNPNSWNPLNAAQISPDDADQCTGLKAFTIAAAGIAPQNFLMFFKNFTTYLIQGVFGATDFAITRLQTDLGCIAPRSLQFVPGYGIMRLTHLGFAVTDGISDKLQDPEAIRPYLFQESTESDITPIDQSYLYFSKAAQTANPPMYVCAVPLQGNPFTNFSGISLTQGSVKITSAFPVSVYYTRIEAIQPSGQSSFSGEYTINLFNQGSLGRQSTYAQTYTVTLPNNPTVATWRIYIGTTPGGQTGYVSVANGVTSVLITPATVTVPGTPTVGLGGFLTRLFCYDLVLKSWTVVDLPFPISTLDQFRTPGSQPITVMAGLFDGALRRWQAGDTQWDAGATNAGSSVSVQWSVSDAEVFTEGGTVKLFHNQTIIRGDGGPASILATPSINGQTQSSIQAALIALGNNQYEARIRLLKTAENLKLTISGTGPATIESISYQAQPKPIGAPLVYS